MGKPPGEPLPIPIVSWQEGKDTLYTFLLLDARRRAFRLEAFPMQSFDSGYEGKESVLRVNLWIAKRCNVEIKTRSICFTAAEPRLKQCAELLTNFTKRDQEEIPV